MSSATELLQEGIKAIRQERYSVAVMRAIVLARSYSSKMQQGW